MGGPKGGAGPNLGPGPGPPINGLGPGLKRAAGFLETPKSNTLNIKSYKVLNPKNHNAINRVI